MFRTLIYPSSGACDYSVELPHWSYCSRFVVCWRFGAAGCEWCPCCAWACNTDITPTQPHRNSNTHRTKNNTNNVVIQQNSRELLMMDILMSETCWAGKKWNKIASDIQLVFYSSNFCPFIIFKHLERWIIFSMKFLPPLHASLRVTWSTFVVLVRKVTQCTDSRLILSYGQTVSSCLST